MLLSERQKEMFHPAMPELIQQIDPLLFDQASFVSDLLKYIRVNTASPLSDVRPESLRNVPDDCRYNCGAKPFHSIHASDSNYLNVFPELHKSTYILN